VPLTPTASVHDFGIKTPCSLREGLWLVREALGPRAQILAELSGQDSDGYVVALRRVVSPPQIWDLSPLIVSRLADEAVREPA
jgi:hypothetical protein